MISLLSVPHSRKAAYSVSITLKTWSLLEVINVYTLMLVFFVQETTLVARCELHSVAEVKGSEVLLTINALNEFDSRITGVDWRQKIENQRGAVSSAAFPILCPLFGLCVCLST